LIFLLLLALKGTVSPAFELQSFSPEIIGIGGVTSAGSMSLNPSYVADVGFDFSASYVNLYGLKDIQGKEIIASYASKKGYLFRMRVGYLGNSLYREYSYNCEYGYRYSDIFWAGASLNLYGLWIKGYPMCFRASIDMGFTFSLTEKLISAILFRNFSEAFTRKAGSNIPEEFYCSFVYSPRGTEKLISAILFRNFSEAFTRKAGSNIPEEFYCSFVYSPRGRGKLFLEVYKDVYFPFSLRLGTKVKLIKFLFLVAGYQLNPDRFSIGSIIKWRGIRVSFAYFNHSILPGTLYYGFGCCSR